jgi:hypothetical protein
MLGALGVRATTRSSRLRPQRLRRLFVDFSNLYAAVRIAGLAYDSYATWRQASERDTLQVSSGGLVFQLVSTFGGAD